ncbi:MAG: cellulose synthase subunit BcsC-related outer membrane protein [Acidobacteriaceae bacterium]|jgi:tetratricopeptide (TPR) repeat protein
MIKARVIRLWAPAIVLGGVVLAATPIRLEAQASSPPAQASPSVIRSLLDKAHALELRGRLDLAEQTWQQVLLTDPKNTEALGGLARAAKLNHSPALANSYLERLRAIDPNDPNIAIVESTPAGKDQQSQLQQAARLAQAGQYAAAMVIYRQVFGTNPPPGDWALAYYETEAATQDGRAQAVAGLRALLDKDPRNTQYRIALGRVLTYDPATREEGREYLASFPNDPKANEAFRQSLLWDAPNPAMAPQIRAYLETHPDPELAAALQSGRTPANAPAPPAQTQIQPHTPAPAASTLPPTTTTSAIASTKAPPGAAPVPAARTPAPAEVADGAAARTRAAEMAAYQALNAGHIDEAESRFKAILAAEPQNPKALAGMGYVRMQQGNFPGAIGFLEQARQLTPNDKGLASALDTARFWFVMGEGQRALADSDLTTAEKRYQAALDLRPNSAEALAGLGGTFAKAQQPASAIPLFQRAVAADPASVPGWRGLFLAQVQSGNSPAALATDKQVPAAVHTQLIGDPLYLLSLASAYSAVGQPGDAQKTLESALKLPLPADAKGLKADLQLQLAGLLTTTNHLDQAENLYAQVVADDHANAAAWQGLVRVQHAIGHDPDALKSVESMPSATYAASMRDPSFEVTVASIYEAEKKLDEAQQLLQTALTQQTDAGQKPSPELQMQLADLYLLRGNPKLAYPVYQQVLRDHPNRADAWAGLLSALHVTGHDQDAVEQVKSIPPPVRAQLESNPAYLQTMASVYQALGRSREAAPFLSRVEQDYAAESKTPPVDLDIQNAWVLYNGMEDAALYRQLMALGSRSDLTVDQRKTVETIWTNWAVRRANQAAAVGNSRRAIAILNAAAHAFPDNPAVIKALAVGYAQAGQPHQAVLIYKAQNMSKASAADYQAAVAAALAAGDNKDAEVWLRYALAAYPSDPQILMLGARFEQTRGDTARAIKYYRASLKAMPPAPPVPKLAAELGLPASSAPARLPNPAQPQDLSILLAPDSSDLPSPAPAVPVQPYAPSDANPLSPNNDSSRVVPPYMTNPGGKPFGTASPPAAANPPSQPDVRASVQHATSQALAQPQPATGVTPAASTPQAYQAQQVAQLTQQAASQPPPAQSGDQAYGPYVAYIAPPPAAPSAAGADRGVTGRSVLPVQLGDKTPPPVQAQTDMTDVLPTQRYAPSARANEAAREEPEVAAARAARIRQLQQDNAAGTGQSHPPPEEAVTVPTQNAAYSAPPQPALNQGAAQVPQPSTGPVGQFGDIPNTGAQQYPQPRTPPASSRPSAVPRTSPGPAPPAVPIAAPVAVAPTPAPPPPPLAVAAPVPSLAQPFPPIAPDYPLAPPPTDAELEARNLPALRGSFGFQAPLPMTPRQQAESELASLEGSYSGWLGATGIGRYRNGTPGLDRLYDIESPVELSAVIARSVRLTAVALPVFLNPGLLNSSSFTTSYVPYLGTLPANTPFASAQQYANGVGGELQLTTKDLGLAAGYTPYDFLVHNLTGRFHFSTLGGHLSLFATRDPVKDTLLSYAGLRDPGAAPPGPIWGGVISTTGGFRLSLGSGAANFYLSGSGGELTGRHVLANTMFQGTTGATFRVRNWSGGSLALGYTLSGMHYQHNEVGLSYGQGGYFSPGSYFLAAIPLTLTGHSSANFHYIITGAFGVQTFEQEEAPFYPLDPALQSSFMPSNGIPCTAAQTPSYNCGEYPTQDSTLFSYAVNAEAAYRFADHWYGGAYLLANNINNYDNVSAGFFFRYVFSAQHSAEGFPSGLFHLQGLRPLQIP